MWPLFFLDKKASHEAVLSAITQAGGGIANMLSAVEVAREMDDSGWLVSVVHWLPLSSLLRIRRQLLSLTL